MPGHRSGQLSLPDRVVSSSLAEEWRLGEVAAMTAGRGARSIGFGRRAVPRPALGFASLGFASLGSDEQRSSDVAVGRRRWDKAWTFGLGTELT